VFKTHIPENKYERVLCFLCVLNMSRNNYEGKMLMVLKEVCVCVDWLHLVRIKTSGMPWPPVLHIFPAFPKFLIITLNINCIKEME
jgi:hypothetical protein